MSKQAFEKIKSGLDEAIIIAPYVAEIERLRAENEKLRAATTPICVGRGIIGIIAKEGAWISEDGASVIAADELFQRDPYEEIEKLRAALKPFADAAAELEDKEHGAIWESPAAMCITASDLRNCKRLLDGSRAVHTGEKE